MGLFSSRFQVKLRLLIKAPVLSAASAGEFFPATATVFKPKQSFVSAKRLEKQPQTNTSPRPPPSSDDTPRLTR